jgi:N-acetylglucosamine-6-phosphate deacetylase
MAPPVIAVRGARLVLPDRVVEGGTLFIDGTRIADVSSRATGADRSIDRSGALIVPGFIDVHVHGSEGHDTLDGAGAISEIARRLPRYGVTAFCPTTVACAPAALIAALDDVRRLRALRSDGARVIAAHLESNFINPDYCGAQPRHCLRLPPGANASAASIAVDEESYTGEDLLRAILDRGDATGIVTLAPELPQAQALIRTLIERGIRVSVGHSGASYEEACAAIAAGARHATHLFNRMPPVHHRRPGLAAAVLDHDEVDAEVICDGYHVHPAVARIALRAKSADRILAITDGTAGAGLPVGSRARLGSHVIHVRREAAFLDDGTVAGSTLTMDAAFRMVVHSFGCPVVEATRLCATNPARALGVDDQGSLLPGNLADFVVLDTDLSVAETWIGGECVWSGRS